MFNPQTMSDYESRDLRNKVFHLLKLYTSFTFLDHGRQAYQDFLDASARQLNDPGLVKSEPDDQRWYGNKCADGSYEDDYREFLKHMIPIEEGLDLLRKTPHKAEAYRSILSSRFTDGLCGRGAAENAVDYDPFYMALGIRNSTRDAQGVVHRAEHQGYVLKVFQAKEGVEALKKTIESESSLIDGTNRWTQHWTYESLFNGGKNPGVSFKFPPLSFPSVLSPSPPQNSIPEGQIWSGEEIPVTGIWEAWFIEEPVKAGVLGGLVDKLTGKPPANEEPVFTGKVGCPNYFLAGAIAFEYEMEVSDRKVEVAWRLLWEDTRYLDGTIPEEENNYFATASTAPPPTVLTAYPGDPCPEAGEWYSVNWNDRKAVLQKGDPMPGPKHSATGAVIWHRKM